MEKPYAVPNTSKNECLPLYFPYLLQKTTTYSPDIPSFHTTKAHTSLQRKHSFDQSRHVLLSVSREGVIEREKGRKEKSIIRDADFEGIKGEDVIGG